MPRCLSRVSKEPLKEVANRYRRGLRAIDRESHHAPGEVIDDDGKPPAEGPDLRQGDGEPGDPETQCGRHGRKIDVPEVIGVPGGKDARGLLGGTARSWPFPIAKHPTFRRWGEVKACASKDLGNFHLPERRTENFQAPHDVPDELGKAIDRFGQLDERVGPS